MPACSTGHGKSGTQISVAHVRPSAQPFSGKQLQPSSPAGHPSLVELETSACPVEVPVVPPLELPLDPSVELASPVV